jgi:hypothetical protein
MPQLSSGSFRLRPLTTALAAVAVVAAVAAVLLLLLLPLLDSRGRHCFRCLS